MARAALACVAHQGERQGLARAEYECAPKVAAEVARAEEAAQVQVEFKKGATVMFSMPLQRPVAALYVAVYAHGGVPRDQWALWAGGKRLDEGDGATLASCGIGRNSVIEVRGRVRGGAPGGGGGGAGSSGDGAAGGEETRAVLPQADACIAAYTV